MTKIGKTKGSQGQNQVQSNLFNNKDVFTLAKVAEIIENFTDELNELDNLERGLEGLIDNIQRIIQKPVDRDKFKELIEQFFKDESRESFSNFKQELIGYMNDSFQDLNGFQIQALILGVPRAEIDNKHAWHDKITAEATINYLEEATGDLAELMRHIKGLNHQAIAKMAQQQEEESAEEVIKGKIMAEYRLALQSEVGSKRQHVSALEDLPKSAKKRCL